MPRKIKLEDVLLQIILKGDPKQTKWYVVIGMLGTNVWKKNKNCQVYFGKEKFEIEDRFKTITYCGREFVIADDFYDYIKTKASIDIPAASWYLKTFELGSYDTGMIKGDNGSNRLSFVYYYKPIETIRCPGCPYFEEGAYSAECNICPHIVTKETKEDSLHD